MFHYFRLLHWITIYLIILLSYFSSLENIYSFWFCESTEPQKPTELAPYENEWFLFKVVHNVCMLSVCPTEVGGMFVAKEYCGPITDKTPISYILPTTKEAGLCSYALLDFLTRKQNDFLDKYMLESKRFVYGLL